MAEVILKEKVTLERKEETVPFTFDERMEIDLVWSSFTDLDLCLFWKTKDGNEGGVFSNEYNRNMDDLGSLDKFPFILHLRNEKKPRQGVESYDKIKVKNIDAFSELYICVVNYEAAAEEYHTTFSRYYGRVEITTDEGDCVEIPMNAPEEGHVYLVCKIDNSDPDNKVINNEARVLSVGQSFRQIPGFKLICNTY